MPHPPTLNGYWATDELDRFNIAAANGNSTVYPSAAYWAAVEWYPQVIGVFIVTSLIPLLAAYEFLIHIPTEATIWWRLTQWRRTKRGVLPLAIIWLRYTTLILGIMYGIDAWDRNQSISSCTNIIWPLECAMIGIVSMSIGCINAWRSRAIARAAIRSKTRYVLLEIALVFLLLARLAALIVAFTYASLWSRYFHILSDFDLSYEQKTCSSLPTAIQQVIIRNPTSVQVNLTLAPQNALLALLITVVATDFAFAIVSLASIFRLKRDIQTYSTFIASLFNSSIMFYSMLIIFDLAGVAYVAATTNGIATPVITTIASILTVRVLINEQETILAANLHSQANRNRRAATRNDAAVCTTQHNMRRPNQLDVCDVQRAPSAVRRIARASDLATHGGCAQNPLFGLGTTTHWQRQPIARNGAGLTDIERVTVLEAGHSVDRPWPLWDDDEELAGEEGMGDTRRVAGERNGLQTLIREWWQDVESSTPPPSHIFFSGHQGTAAAAMAAANGGIRTYDGGVEQYDSQNKRLRQGAARTAHLRSRSNTIDACQQLDKRATRTSASDEQDEKDSTDIPTSDTSNEQQHQLADRRRESFTPDEAGVLDSFASPSTQLPHTPFTSKHA